MNYISYSNLVSDIKRDISFIQNQGYDLVVGIPRSGMIPSYIISSLLNIDCTDISSFLLNTPLRRGITKKLPFNLSLPSDSSKVLLVDDSIDRGVSLKKILTDIPVETQKKITTLAIYSSYGKRDDVDLFFKYLPHPRVFEWNIFHHNVLTETCVDIDGVLCRDPTEEENDDGDKYRHFIRNVTPIILPTGRIHSLVTNRLEKYRMDTTVWLDQMNINYDRLVMLDLPSKEDRIRLRVHAKHKAEYYKKSTSQFFIESDPVQSKRISELSGKPVYCFQNNKLYSPKATHIIRNNPPMLVTVTTKTITALINKYKKR